MPRHILDSHQVHPSIRQKIDLLHRDVIDEVKAALAAHPVVVVGMQWNPFSKRACKALQSAGVRHHYLEYGSYLSQWRRRNALKMWTGWPTFPMVFVKGQLVGGAQDVERLLASGELRQML
jgi:monothiol glutaredoxin